MTKRTDRRSQRIELAEPLQGSFGMTTVTVVELSESGAAIEHRGFIAIRTAERLRVEARPPFEISASIVHSVMIATAESLPECVYRSGVTFHDVSDETRAVIESVLLDEALRTVRLWEANASGITISPAIEALQRRSKQRRAPSDYVWMRLTGDRWERTATRDPNQPLDGFAVLGTEEPDDIALLCRTYQASSEDERNLIRALAQLAIAERLAENRGMHPRRG